MRKITKEIHEDRSRTRDRRRSPSPTKKGSHGDKKILSIAIDPQLHAASLLLPAVKDGP